MKVGIWACYTAGILLACSEGETPPLLLAFLLLKREPRPFLLFCFAEIQRKSLFKAYNSIVTCKASFQVQDLNTGRYCPMANGSLYQICTIHTAILAL